MSVPKRFEQSIIALHSNNTVGSIFTTAGNVGINTTSPNSTFHVNGDARITGLLNVDNINVTSTTTSNLRVLGSVTASNLSVPGTLTVTNMTVNNLLQSAGNINITGNSNTIGSIFTTGGNVGIGRTAPSYSLDVNGVINCPASISSAYGSFMYSGKRFIHCMVSSVGLGFVSDQSTAGVWLNGVLVSTTLRSWGLTVIGGSGSNIGKVIFSKTYDVYINSAEATTMTNDISIYNANNNILIITTFDEPQQNGDTVRTYLQNSLSAKLAYLPNNSRYAYCYAYHNGYGTLGEAHSSYYNNGYVASGSNSNPSRCAFQFLTFI